ncbi:MAG: DUF2294 domain-containing protein [Cellulosilyticum sp.]|nr:DUF2294 domain-containing protein [Cellulosilyticum sp.]
MTKGQLEAKISEIVSKFEVEYMGRGPKIIKTYIINDMIFVRLIGFLSPSEQKLTDNPQGIELFKKVRTSLFEGGRGYLETLIMDVMDVAVVSTHSDISTKTGEKIIAITVDRNLEEYIKSITEDNTK